MTLCPHLLSPQGLQIPSTGPFSRKPGFADFLVWLAEHSWSLKPQAALAGCPADGPTGCSSPAPALGNALVTEATLKVFYD